MKKTMLVNVVEPEEGRVAILKDKVLDELYIERTQKETYLGNIYKARVANVEPAIQAAFVDFGGEKQGFLHVSDVLPQISKDSGKASGRRGRHRLIQNVLRRGQELLVQVTRDGDFGDGSRLGKMHHSFTRFCIPDSCPELPRPASKEFAIRAESDAGREFCHSWDLQHLFT